MARGTNTFGLNEQQVADMNRADGEKVASWLKEKYEEEREQLHKNGTKGIELTDYRCISEKTRGVQNGIWGIVAKSNIGKTTFMTHLCCDMLKTFLRTSMPVKCCFYTFDDSKDEIRLMLIACWSQVNKHFVDQKIDFPGMAKKVQSAYSDFQKLALADMFIIKDIEDFGSIKQLEEDIAYQKSLADEKGYGMAVFLDGQSNLETGISSIRESNIHKANALQRLTIEHKIPIIVTLEVPKLTNRWRPIKEDIAESVKYAYNAKVLISLSPIDNLTEESEGYSQIMFKFTKNKFSGFKGAEYGYLKGGLATFEMETDQSKRESLRAKAFEFDKVFLKSAR